MGYHFNWKHGSLIGLMHKSQFESIPDFQECNLGDVVEVGYQGLNKENHMILGNKCDQMDWVKGKPQELVGQVISVRVKVDNKLGTQSFRLLQRAYSSRYIFISSFSINGRVFSMTKLASIE